MIIKDFIFQNLYYFVSAIALVSGLITYLYFYNREALSASSGEIKVPKESKETDSITVDLSGAVDRPGIYSLDAGSRLADLISLSGGATSEVSQKWLSHNLNLSAFLRDQQKIYIPFEWEVAPEAPEYKLKTLEFDPVVAAADPSEEAGDDESDDTEEDSGKNESSKSATSKDSGDVSGEDTSAAGAPTDSSGDLINVNEASAEELKELPGIGDAFAEKIIKNRPYAKLADLGEKAGVYASTLEKIKGLISF
ncbi:hypothetical protein GF360_00120 [candidate division WWE3 bacterium]|nr:hypothetical protein [candidate division WWE3 bacterium]